LLQDAFVRFKYDDLNIRKLLAANGTNNRSQLPNYFFRDDALVLWDAIYKFVSKILHVFYLSNEVKEIERAVSNETKIKAIDEYVLVVLNLEGTPPQWGVDKCPGCASS